LSFPTNGQVEEDDDGAEEIEIFFSYFKTTAIILPRA
jgi:hypothetical protein